MNVPLPDRPQLKPWYRTAETPSGLAVEYGQRVVCFEGAGARRLLPALLPLLDGTRTAAELALWFGPGAGPAVENALELLARHGLLEEGSVPLEDEPRPFVEAARFLAATGAAAATEARALLTSSCVGVAGGGPLGLEVARLLRLCGAAVEAVPLSGGRGAEAGRSLDVVAPLGGEVELVPAWNAAALEGEAPWLLVLPFDGRYAAVGPVFVPGETCCFECFRLRRLAALDLGDEFWALERCPAPSRACPPVDAVCAGLAATVALRVLAGGSAELCGAFLALELGSPAALTYHRVLRVPRCPACSGLAGLAPPLPWFKEPSVDSAG